MQHFVMKEKFVIKEICDNDHPYDFRFVIVDPDTGSILDDAEGKGYKTRPKAYGAYRYKIKKWKKERESE